MWPGTDVTLHHHPQYATAWSTAGELPPVYDQLSAMLPDSAYVLYDDYDGTAAQLDSVRRLMASVGSARCVLLRNHGVFVVGDTIEQAYLNASILELPLPPGVDGQGAGHRRPGDARGGTAGHRRGHGRLRLDRCRAPGSGRSARSWASSTTCSAERWRRSSPWTHGCGPTPWSTSAPSGLTLIADPEPEPLFCPVLGRRPRARTARPLRRPGARRPGRAGTRTWRWGRTAARSG